MNLKNESIFMTLSGYSKEITDIDDTFAIKLAKSINKYFSKNKKRYSPRQVESIVKYLKEFEAILPQPHSPTMLMLLAIEHLLVSGHIETRIAFGHFSSEIRQLKLRIRTSQYRDKFLEHIKFFEDYVNN